MKLLYYIITRLSILLISILAIWALLFYVALMDEINDEVDDSLEDFSEQIITHSLAGEELPAKNNGSNNQYYLSEVSAEYADKTAHIRYIDSMIYITQKSETEPARILSTIFRNNAGEYYKLTVSTPTIEKNDLKEAILYWMIFLYISLLIMIILVNIWIYYKSTRPLFALLRWFDNYRVGSTSVELFNDSGIREFSKLNKSVTDSMQRVEQVFEKQKQFIGNASHEIQTPLAVSLNRLEILMEDETLSEKHLEELAKTHQTLEYMVKLNKSLLLLSKIDNKQFPDDQYIDLNAIVRNLMPDYEEVYAYKNIKISLVETGIFKVKMNDLLAVITINNLLKNSYVHNTNGGHILIGISPSSIVFRNSAQDKALNGNLIFDRFYQGSPKEGSTGLGLAIVKSICDTTNLSIKYFFDKNEHCFEIFC